MVIDIHRSLVQIRQEGFFFSRANLHIHFYLHIGMIPRAVHQIFFIIDEKKAEAKEKGEIAPVFEVTAEFLEVS